MSKNPASGKIDEQMAKYSSPKTLQIYLLLFAIGLLIFFTVTFTFSFKDKVFKAFFQRPFSFAEEEDMAPGIDLIAGVDNLFRKGMINVENGTKNISLKWQTQNAPASCQGRFWSNIKKEDSWIGSKNPGGGEYKIGDDLATGIYIYSINCANESGDSSGAGITINVGARRSGLKPHITEFKVSSNGKEIDNSELIRVDKNTKVAIEWSAINTETLFGVCTANGSWPTIYKDTGNLEVKEAFVLDQAKIYKYSLFCSNENGYDTEAISFMVR